MDVVSHSCCGLGVGRDGGLVGRYGDEAMGLVACQEMPEHFPCAR